LAARAIVRMSMRSGVLLSTAAGFAFLVAIQSLIRIRHTA
jgi:hypothetical protein